MTDEATYQVMLTEWHSLGSLEVARVDAWQSILVGMREEMLDLRSRGLWRSGGRTLMRQFGLQHDEVMLCRGLAWLLTPDGWHGLGDVFLKGLLNALALPTDGVERATVSLEEVRSLTRADIVVRYPGACVLIEAKVFAGEQLTQADRLAREWDEEDPHLVFLTRDGRRPVTARESAGRWTCLRWSDLVTLAESAVQVELAPSPGALELIHTWKHYGG